MADRTVTVALRANTSDYTRSLATAERSTLGLSRSVDHMQAGTHRAFTHLSRTLAGGAITGALGGIVVSSVKAAAAFDTTMRQIAVATGAGSASIKGLNDLALKMGQDTVFSAQDAGAAMLELAKGGLNEAQIRAGALSSTLTLASAGGLDLASSAGYIVQGLSTFNLKADQAATVAAALAGGANASTASVQEMGLALSQVGPGAQLAGLSLQETTGVLAAFAQNGIKGSDAGTSLKTMLSRLVPQTKQQAEAMAHLHLKFTDAHGAFLGIDQIAQQLHDHLSGLSQAQRTSALNTIFGTDASRAAAVLMKEGAAGVRDYTKATSDKTQADKLAQAATSGTAGALSQLSGSVDTAKLKLGQALAPLIVDLANHMTVWANSLSTDVIPALEDFIQGMENGTGPGGKFRDVLDEIGHTGHEAWQVVSPFFHFVGAHPKLFTEIAKDALIFAGAMKVIGAVRSLPIPGVGRGGGRGGGALGAGSGVVPVFVTNVGKLGLGGTGGLPTKVDRLSMVVGTATLAGSIVISAKLGHDIGVAAATELNKHADRKLSPTQVAARSLIEQTIKDMGRTGKGIESPEFKDALSAAGRAVKDDKPGQALGTRSKDSVNLVAAYDFLKKYGAKTQEVQALLRQLAKDPTVAAALKDRAAQITKNADLISGGLSKTKAYADATSRAMADIGPKFSPSAAAAREKFNELRDKADALSSSIKRIPDAKPKVHLTGAPQAFSWVRELGQGLDGLDGRHVTATVDIVSHFAGFGRTSESKHEKEGGHARGGSISGPGGPTSDSVELSASAGEYVVNERAAALNRTTLDAMNFGGATVPYNPGPAPAPSQTILKKETTRPVHVENQYVSDWKNARQQMESEERLAALGGL